MATSAVASGAEPVAIVYSLSGSAWIQPTSGARQKAERFAWLSSDAVVEVGPDSTLLLAFVERHPLRAGPGGACEPFERRIAACAERTGPRPGIGAAAAPADPTRPSAHPPARAPCASEARASRACIPTRTRARFRTRRFSHSSRCRAAPATRSRWRTRAATPSSAPRPRRPRSWFRPAFCGPAAATTGR